MEVWFKKKLYDLDNVDNEAIDDYIYEYLLKFDMFKTSFLIAF